MVLSRARGGESAHPCHARCLFTCFKLTACCVFGRVVSVPLTSGGTLGGSSPGCNRSLQAVPEQGCWQQRGQMEQRLSWAFTWEQSSAQ